MKIFIAIIVLTWPGGEAAIVRGKTLYSTQYACEMAARDEKYALRAVYFGAPVDVHIRCEPGYMPVFRR